jgi:hypothetical protein
MKLLSFSIVALLVAAGVESVALSNQSSCGFDILTAEELTAAETQGKIVQRSDISGGILNYSIDQYYTLEHSDIERAIALYWDQESLGDSSGLVDTRLLADGYTKSSNPIVWNITPGERNPLGPLYTPFSQYTAITKTETGYSLDVHTLSSPTIVGAVRSAICFENLPSSGHVAVSVLSKFVGNPQIGFDSFFGLNMRLLVWEQVSASIRAHMNNDFPSAEQVENVKLSLQLSPSSK